MFPKALCLGDITDGPQAKIIFIETSIFVDTPKSINRRKYMVYKTLMEKHIYTGCFDNDLDKVRAYYSG